MYTCLQAHGLVNHKKRKTEMRKRQDMRNKKSLYCKYAFLEISLIGNCLSGKLALLEAILRCKISFGGNYHLLVKMFFCCIRFAVRYAALHNHFLRNNVDFYILSK